MQTVVFDGIAQGARYRLLSGNFFKCLRSPFSSDNLVGHKAFVLLAFKQSVGVSF
jgi:hypothetical protein